MRAESGRGLGLLLDTTCGKKHKFMLQKCYLINCSLCWIPNPQFGNQREGWICDDKMISIKRGSFGHYLCSSTRITPGVTAGMFSQDISTASWKHEEVLEPETRKSVTSSGISLEKDMQIKTCSAVYVTTAERM